VGEKSPAVKSMKQKNKDAKQIFVNSASGQMLPMVKSALFQQYGQIQASLHF
jgi:hypothetical protein